MQMEDVDYVGCFVGDDETGSALTAAAAVVSVSDLEEWFAVAEHSAEGFPFPSH